MTDDVIGVEMSKSNAVHTLQPFHGVDKTGHLGTAWNIDLLGIAADDHAAAFAKPGEEHLHLFPSGVLSLIEDDESIGKSAAAHESDGRYFDLAAGDPALHLLGRQAVVEGIIDWAEIRIYLLLHVAWKEAEALTCFYSGTGEDETLDLAGDKIGNSLGHCQISLASASWANRKEHFTTCKLLHIAGLCWRTWRDRLAAGLDGDERRYHRTIFHGDILDAREFITDSIRMDFMAIPGFLEESFEQAARSLDVGRIAFDGDAVAAGVNQNGCTIFDSDEIDIKFPKYRGKKIRPVEGQDFYGLVANGVLGAAAFCAMLFHHVSLSGTGWRPPIHTVTLTAVEIYHPKNSESMILKTVFFFSVGEFPAMIGLSGEELMGLFDKVAANLGIQTAGNAELMDIAGYAKLPREHPVVELADRAGTRGLGASDMEMRQLFGDPISRDANAPVAPREMTPARYNWVARRTLDQMLPKIGESHVDQRIPSEVRLAMSSAIARMIDPFGETKGSIMATRMRDEAAMSKRIVGYLQASPDEVARRGSEMLDSASDDDLRAEFELVSGTSRMRIPQDQRGRQAWVEERLRTEHAMAKAGVLPASSVLDAASRLDIIAQDTTEAPLMAPYQYDALVNDAMSMSDEVNRLSDIDLRFRFKALGGMGSADIPDGPARGDWVLGMMIEERQTEALTAEQQRSLTHDRQAIAVSMPSPQSVQSGQVKLSVSMVINAAQAAGI